MPKSSPSLLVPTMPVRSWGQRVEQGVVDLSLLLSHHKGHQQHKKDDHDGHCVLGNKVAEFGQLGHDGAVLVLFDC